MVTQTRCVLGVPEVSANLYCNSRTSVLEGLHDYLRLLMKRSVCVDLKAFRSTVVAKLFLKIPAL